MNNPILDNDLLLTAAEKGDLSTMQQLIAAGANINLKNSFDENLIFLACKSGHLETVKFLLAHGADPSQGNSGNQDAMHAACIKGNLAIVQELIKHGANVRQLSSARKLPISWAFRYGHSDIIKYFFENNLIEKEDFQYFRLLGADKDNIKILAILVALGPILKPEMIHNFFDDLLAGKKLKSLQYMLEHFFVLKTSLGQHFYTLLYACCELKVDKDLTFKNAKSDIFKKYQQQFSFYQGKNKTLEFLLQHGLAMNTPNNEDQTLLHFAATMQFDEYEHISHLKCLLDLGYPIDILNSKQQTPLHIAIQHGMFFHALYFIYSGADLNAVDNEGRTIVDYANDFCSAGMEANDPYNLEYKQDLLQTLGDYKGS